MSIDEGRHANLEANADASPTPGRPRHSAGRRRSLWTAVILLIIFDLVVGVIAKDANRQHADLAQIRKASAELADASGQTLLVLGGTAAATDIDPSRLNGVLDVNRSEWTTVAAPVEASTIAVWSATFDQHFARTDRRPDVVTIGFVNDELEDQNPVDWTTIGNLHTGWGSLGDRWQSAPDLNAKLDVAGSWASAVIGNREWLFDLVSVAIPNHSAVPRLAPGAPDDSHTFTTLSEFIATIRNSDTQVAVVALPTQRSYQLPDGLQTAVEDAGGVLIDLRLEGGLTEEQFRSSASLTPAAATEFSGRLAAELNARLE